MDKTQAVTEYSGLGDWISAMKHSALRAILHNIADSLASGCSFMFGAYNIDIYADAAKSGLSGLRVDFKSGRVLAGRASPKIEQLLVQIPEVLASRCAAAGAAVDEIVMADITFRSLRFGDSFTIEMEDILGRKSKIRYFGSPARRLLERDANGRLRRMKAHNLFTTNGGE
jgi:hypothetical protein